jgi:hypothetical protein
MPKTLGRRHQEAEQCVGFLGRPGGRLKHETRKGVVPKYESSVRLQLFEVERLTGAHIFRAAITAWKVIKIGGPRTGAKAVEIL